MLFSVWSVGIYANVSKEVSPETAKLYQACLKGVSSSLKNDPRMGKADLESLVTLHEKAKKSCRCMALDKEIMKMAKQLTDHQKDKKTDPFALSDEYQALLLKTKKRCFHE
jgi:hypothetical protein